MADHLLVQISDVHLSSEGQLFAGTDPRDNLVASLRFLADAGVRPDMVVLTGDLANAGEPQCYEDLAGLMDQSAGAIGAEVAYLPGNHDERSAFRTHLLDQSPDASPINQTRWHGGLRVVLLDSTAVGQEFGELADETLAYLSDALSTPAPDGTVVALHHPPLPSPVRPMAQIMLRRPEQLADVVDGSDVRLIICGHDHHGMSGTLASVPVWASPATAYQMDVLSTEAVRGLRGCSLSQIDLTDAGTTVSVITVPLDGQ